MRWYSLISEHVLSELAQAVSIIQDDDQYSTDLMKCVSALQEREAKEGQEVCKLLILS